MKPPTATQHDSQTAEEEAAQRPATPPVLHPQFIFPAFLWVPEHHICHDR